ncbi:MAG: class I SAM-dependent methyltransferase [Gammaproteobacteria bacterium]|nr:class I SAM-dependent methyltransferase [Gammaproteobacteria bacterium]
MSATINPIELVNENDHLQLINRLDPKMTPLAIDFLSYYHDMTLGQGGRRLLLKALGVKDKVRMHVLDATAGLGRDAFFMAKFGLDVTMIERSPLLAQLLNNALKHNATTIKRLKLLSGDALKLIPTLAPFEVIYLDPMFPQKKSKAKVKKDLQILQILHQDEPQDSTELLKIALKHTKNRVVVKRPINAPFLDFIQPQWSLRGTTIRFDVYVSR